jgi:hypothetical protein
MSQEKKLKLWKMAVEKVEQNWDMENDRPKESQEQQQQQPDSQAQQSNPSSQQ